MSLRRLLVALPVAATIALALVAAPAAGAAAAPAPASAAQQPVNTTGTVSNGKINGLTAECQTPPSRPNPNATMQYSRRDGVQGVSIQFGKAGENAARLTTIKSVTVLLAGKGQRTRTLTAAQLKKLVSHGRVHSIFLPNAWSPSGKKLKVAKWTVKFHDPKLCQQDASPPAA